MVALLAWVLGCAEPVVFTEDQIDTLASMSPVPEAPVDPTNAVSDDPQAARLGQQLFFSQELSADGSVSCATCHDPAQGFADGQLLAEGLDVTSRHAPTLYNLAWSRWLYWDGRRDSLWSQALSPLEDAGEHGLDRDDVLDILAKDAALAEAYEAVFGPLPAGDASDWDVDVVFSDVGKAIAAYERLLVTGEAPFDQMVDALVQGDATGGEAVDEAVKRGAQLFVGEAGCVACHSGPLLTDHAFHNIGLGPRDWLDSDDRGRWDGLELALDDPFSGVGAFSDDPDAAWLKHETATLDPESLGGFKTPGLRQVALTAPYMHGGHFETLDEVLLHYIEIRELPEHGHREEVLVERDLSVRDRADLVAFLESLTGEGPDPSLLSAP